MKKSNDDQKAIERVSDLITCHISDSEILELIRGIISSLNWEEKSRILSAILNCVSEMHRESELRRKELELKRKRLSEQRETMETFTGEH